MVQPTQIKQSHCQQAKSGGLPLETGFLSFSWRKHLFIQFTSGNQLSVHILKAIIPKGNTSPDSLLLETSFQASGTPSSKPQM